MCDLQTSKKYRLRPSPPFPANQCRGQIMEGNDGLRYISSRNINGIHIWRKVDRASNSKYPRTKKFTVREKAGRMRRTIGRGTTRRRKRSVGRPRKVGRPKGSTKRSVGRPRKVGRPKGSTKRSVGRPRKVGRPKKK